ncbi:hypothetical protein B0H11DRAFT_1898750 [Mycena galericulata]|nr:hypothetical protein B0H11DRAFT_1898750 [Mycena galericulata]
MVQSLEVRLVKEVASLGLGHMDADKAVIHKLIGIVDLLRYPLSVADECEAVITESIEIKLMGVVIEMRVVGVDIKKATQLVKNLENENWFPRVAEHVFRQRWQTIADRFEKQIGRVSRARAQEV